MNIYFGENGYDTNSQTLSAISDLRRLFYISTCTEIDAKLAFLSIGYESKSKDINNYWLSKVMYF